ncbi:MAG: VanZ family protein [Thiotrichales bacterium]|nr:VanZ family protein [Thiotrichales bacterium]
MMRTLWIFIGWLIIVAVLYLSLFKIYIPVQTDFKSIDKIHHFIAYATLMLWFAQSFGGTKRYWVAGGLVLMGIVIEFAQPFTGREFSYMDMIANSTGVLIGLLIAAKGGDFLYPKLKTQ